MELLGDSYNVQTCIFDFVAFNVILGSLVYLRYLRQKINIFAMPLLYTGMIFLVKNVTIYCTAEGHFWINSVRVCSKARWTDI